MVAHAPDSDLHPSCDELGGYGLVRKHLEDIVPVMGVGMPGEHTCRPQVNKENAIRA